VTCPRCVHPAHVGRCPVDTCPCKCSRPSLVTKPPKAPPVPLPQDQRESDLAEVETRLRQAVWAGELAPVKDICRACWNAGFTARERQPKR